MKFRKGLILGTCCIILTGCANSAGSGGSLDSADKLLDSVEAFEIIYPRAYAVSGGQVVYWEDDHWETYTTENAIDQIFAGEHFCALAENGRLVWENESTDLAGLPLTTASNYYASQQLMEINQNRPFQTLNKTLASEYVIALCEDGEMITLPSRNNYEVTVIPFDREVAQLSGDFVLTKEGDVYLLKGFDRDSISPTLVSENPILEISACATAPRCIGICEDGTVTMWSDLENLDLSEWTDIAAVEMGFNYCAGLSEDGNVYFAAYDPEIEAQVNEWLAGRKAVAIACAFQTLALLQEDMSVVMIDFS